MNKKDAQKGIYTFTGMGLFSILIYYVIIPSQIHMNSTAKAEAFNPDTFPRFCTVILFIASVLGLINVLIKYYKCRKNGTLVIDDAAKEKKTKKEIMTIIIPYVIFALSLVYGILFKSIGFVPATAIIIPVILLVIGCRKWNYYAIVYVFSAVIYVLFRFVLNVPIH